MKDEEEVPSLTEQLRAFVAEDTAWANTQRQVTARHP